MIIVPYPGMAIEFLLDQVWYTPQNTMLPIAVAYVTDPDYTHYAGSLHMKASASTINGYEIKFGITLLGGAAHYEVFGTSITTSSANFGTLLRAYFGKNYGANSNFAMIYTLGQIAIANFSEWIVGEIAVYVGEVTMTFLTQLWINGTNGAYVPAMWTTNWPYISPTDYFQNEKLNYSGISIAPHSSNGYELTSIFVSTSYDALSGGIPLEVVLKFLEYVLHVSIPSWVSHITFVADPEVSITTFTTSSTIVISYVGLADLTYSYKYYIYYSQTSSMYRIGENYFYIPFFYFYINYTIG